VGNRRCVQSTILSVILRRNLEPFVQRSSGIYLEIHGKTTHTTLRGRETISFPSNLLTPGSGCSYFRGPEGARPLMRQDQHVFETFSRTLSVTSNFLLVFFFERSTYSEYSEPITSFYMFVIIAVYRLQRTRSPSHSHDQNSSALGSQFFSLRVASTHTV
jgi:hypothetical protein